jgi:hypothetical protein
VKVKGGTCGADELGAVSLRRVRSFRPDAGELDHFGPLLGFADDELSKISWRAGHRRDAEIGKPCLDGRVRHGSIDLAVEQGDDFG